MPGENDKEEKDKTDTLQEKTIDEIAGRIKRKIEESNIQMHLHKNDRPDSVEISTPSKGGAVKVYFNAANPDEAKKLIENAFEMRTLARKLNGDVVE